MSLINYNIAQLLLQNFIRGWQVLWSFHPLTIIAVESWSIQNSNIIRWNKNKVTCQVHVLFCINWIVFLRCWFNWIGRYSFVG